MAQTRVALCLVTAFLCACASTRQAPSPIKATAPPASKGAEKPEIEYASWADLDAIRAYIRTGWQTLRRSNHDLLRAAVDPKSPSKGHRWLVYVAPDEDMASVEHDLLLSLPQSDMEQLEVRPLGPAAAKEPGILYLPRPYVVPGGRFNEMYGWDSYFIVTGLLRDGEVELARDMTDNLLYEVLHYGSVLNANRSYYLTRSQPPFLSAMVLDVFARTHDMAWLRDALPTLEKYYQYWMQPPHLTESGLSRYFDTGHGPAPEVMSGEQDADGIGAYQRVKDYYRTHPVPDYDKTLYYNAKRDKLTDLFFVGDRSMRESGFDPSARFGPFNVGITTYNPVCLNSLLYVMEKQLGEIHTRMGNVAEAANYEAAALQRAERINKLNWDDHDGFYFDYDFVDKLRRPYAFATTFYPMWAGIASKEQAARLVANLHRLEAPGGLVTSTTQSGNQWDAPYGWAPLNQLAVQGLRRYGYHAEADRISINFLSMLLGDFMHTHAIFEKYDVTQRASDVSQGLLFGYTSNEVGFGWTNAAFEELYAQLPREARARILALRGVPLP